MTFDTMMSHDIDFFGCGMNSVIFVLISKHIGLQISNRCDHVVKETGGPDWAPLEDVPSMSTFRHDWILRRRRRPVAPHFKGCPLPKHMPNCSERNAMITMTYFHPWTLREKNKIVMVGYSRKGVILWYMAMMEYLRLHMIRFPLIWT